MLKVIQILLFTFLTSFLIGQKPIMLQRYFQYLKNKKDKTELVDRLKNYIDYLINNKKKEEFKQLAFIYDAEISLSSQQDSMLWRKALTRYAYFCNKELSDFDLALNYYLKAHELVCNKEFYDTLVWKTENEIANIYNRLGDLERTQYFQKITENSLRHFKDHKNLSLLMVNKAQLQLDSGNKNLAYQSYHEGIKIAQSISYARGQLANFINLGKLYTLDHQIKEAQKMIDASKQIISLVDKHPFKYAGELKELEAMVRVQEKKYTAAIQLYGMAEENIRAEYNNNGKRREIVKLTIERIKAALAQGNHQRARHLADSTLSVFLPESRSDVAEVKAQIYPDNIFVDLYLLKSKASYALQDFNEAIPSLEIAMYANELLRKEYLDSPSRLTSVALNKDLLGFGLDLLYEHGLQSGKKQNNHTLLTFFNASRGLLLSQKKQEAEALKNLKPIERRRLKVLEAKMEKIYDEGIESEEEKQALAKLKMDKYELIQRGKSKEKTSIEITADNTLQYAFSEKYLYRFSKIGSKEKFERTGSRERAQQLTHEIRRAIVGQENVDTLLKNAFTFFMGRLEAPLPARLLILPDEFLFELPFDVLKDADGKYLIEKTTIRYNYKDSDIQNNTSIAAIDLVLPKYQQQPSINNTAIERDGIKSKFKVNEYSDGLNRKGVRSILSGTNPLHYAGHAHNEIETAWLLISDREKIYDYEISNFENRRPFVYLSACNTGLGQLEKGEGLRSLCKSFLEAGVPAVVHSLWEVNDQSSATITTMFYCLLDEGKTGTEALREAKLVYLQNANLQQKNPYYWAAYVYTGDDILLKKPKALKYIGILLGMGGILFITYLIKRK